MNSKQFKGATDNLKIPIEKAKAEYVNRYTMEHKPTWADKPMPGGRFYAPQYVSDQEWYDNTNFPPNSFCLKDDCLPSGQTWPLGEALATPYKVNQPPDGYQIEADIEKGYRWIGVNPQARSKFHASLNRALIGAYRQKELVLARRLEEEEKPYGHHYETVLTKTGQIVDGYFQKGHSSETVFNVPDGFKVKVTAVYLKP